MGNRLAWALVFLLFGVQTSMELRASSILDFQFSENQTYGNIFVDGSVVDSNPDPHKGLYRNAIVGYVIDIDGTPAVTGTPVFRTLQGNSGDLVVGIDADGIGACGTVNCVAFILGTPFLGQGPSDFDLTFYYPSGSLPSDAIPVTLPPIGVGILRSDVQSFFGEAAATQVNPVPEPLSVAQAALGVVTLVLVRRRRSGQACGCARRVWAARKTGRRLRDSWSRLQ